MRHFLLIIATIFISATASAKCSGSGIYILSKSETLNKNGLIILEFYALSQELIPQLNKKHFIYLKSKQGKIALYPIETLKGQFNVTQVVFKPISSLVENETYELYIDNLPGSEKPRRHNNTMVSFKITGTVDTEKPVLNGNITETKSTLVHYGCGPARWTYFKIGGQDKSEYFVKASVKNKSTGEITKYILEVENGEVRVGHGMCSGPFHYDSGKNYEVSFSLIDQSGNNGDMSTAILFSMPDKQTIDE